MKKRRNKCLVSGMLICLVGGSLVLSACGGRKAAISEKDGPAESVDIGEVDQGLLSDDSVAQTDEITAMDVLAEPEVKTLTLTAAGDCTLGKTQDHSYDGSFLAYYDSYGADYFFDNVRPVFEADDMTVVNLECVLSTSDDRVEKTFNLRGKPEYAGILSGSSVEACSMGNNHSYDYGETGFQDTKQVLEEAGITYAYSQKSGMYTAENGIKVGMVSASLLSQSKEKTDALKTQMQEMREAGANLIIACCHWGIEREHYPIDYQKTTAHDLIDAGADLVIGHHPHVLQGVETYKGKVILYSLGNFCFGGNKNPSDKNTMMFQQTFTFEDGQVKTDSIDAKIIPCRVSSASGYNDYQPTIASDDTKQNIIRMVNEYSAPLGNISFDDQGILQEEE